MKKIILAAAFGLAAPTLAAAQDCGEVSITEMNWASSAVETHVSKFLMEQGYGCEVTTIPSATVTSLASVSETGKPDIITELWESVFNRSTSDDGGDPEGKATAPIGATTLN